MRDNLANDYVREADILQRLGRKMEALKSYSRAQILYAGIAGGDHQNIEAKLNLAAADTKVGALRLQLGEADSAADVFRRAITSLEKFQGLSSDQVRYTLAEAYAGMGDVFSYSAGRSATRSRQISNWNEARLWYEKSHGTWNRLTNPGLVSPKGFAACDPVKIRNRLQHSEAVLRKFESANSASRLEPQ
jgi:tetratricopeptide (TPR) repeat protein